MIALPHIWRQAMATARLTRDLPGFVRSAVTPDEAARRVRGRLATREQAFLRLVARTVYCQPRSPYRRLLDHVGCTYGDLAQQIRRDGLDTTLARLADAGVYVTQAEMKGRAEIVRGSLRFRASAGQFDNPLNRPHFIVPTSGSSGAQFWVGRSLAELGEIGDCLSAAFATCGLARPAYIKWSTLPHSVMEDLHLGLPVVGWYNALHEMPWPVGALQHWVWAVVQLAGGSMVRPSEHLLTDAGMMAVRLEALLRAHPAILMDATASSATRVALAAIERGISLRGLVWMPWGEPLTPARERALAAAGSRTLPVYSTTETGPLAMACGARTLADAMHVRRERFAVLPQPAIRRDHAADIADGVRPPGALLVTTVGPAASQIFINAETGDAADALSGRCGCSLDDLGLTQRIGTIRSYEKLTGEGVTLVGADIAAILEETLPRVLGGQPGDFQLLEAEAPDRSVRLILRLRPDAARPPIDAGRARRALLDAVRAQSPNSAHMARLLDAASAIQVEHAAPWVTSTGKTPAFVPLRARRES